MRLEKLISLSIMVASLLAPPLHETKDEDWNYHNEH